MRRQSTAFFLGDVAFLADPKFRALAKRLPRDDDFLAAVGAFFVCLAAARRNGSSHVDAEAETGCSFIEDLRAVGLLNGEGFHESSFKDWAPMAPQQAAAGRARALQAERDTAGRFTSDTSALETLESTVQPSPPLPSPPISSSENGVDLGTKDSSGVLGSPAEPDVLVAYYNLTIKYPAPGSTVHEWLTRLGRDHGHIAASKALAEEYAADPSPRTLLSRTESRLNMAVDQRRAQTAKVRTPVKRETPEEKAERERVRREVLADISRVKEM